MSMNSENVKSSIKRVVADRPFLVLMAVVVVVGIVYCMLTGFAVQPRDVKIYDRYTAFGKVHFYKNYWYYLAGFAAFGTFVTAMHLALMMKLHGLERRQTAIILGLLTIVVLVIAAVYGLSIMGLAFR